LISLRSNSMQVSSKRNRQTYTQWTCPEYAFQSIQRHCATRCK